MYVLHFTKLREFTGELVNKSDADCYASFDAAHGHYLGNNIRFAMMFDTAIEAKQTLLDFKDDFMDYFDCEDNPMFSNKVDIYELKFTKKEIIDVNI